MVFDLLLPRDRQNTDATAPAGVYRLYSKILVCIATTLLAVWSQPAATGEYESLKRIRERAIEFAKSTINESGHHIEIEAEPLDPRLKLPACPGPLHASKAPGSGTMGRIAIAVKCDDKPSWRLYVRLQVHAIGAVVVAEQALLRGRKIEAGDVHIARRDLSQISANHTDDPKRVIGRTLRRSVRVDEVIPLGALAVQTLVHTGQRIKIISGNQQVRISMTGVALSDGTKGEQIRVRNRSSGRIVEGTVIDGGLVDVGT